MENIVFFSKELKTGFSESSNEEKIAASSIDGKNRFIMKLIRDKSYRYYLLIQNLGENMIIPVQSLDEAEAFIRKIQLNLEYQRIARERAHIGDKVQILPKRDLPKEYARIEFDSSFDKIDSNIKDSYRLVSIEDLRIDGMELLRTKKVSNLLIINAMVRDGDKTYIDFVNSGYDDSIQNYLLEHIYGKKIELTPEERESIKRYKGLRFEAFNNFMRGNFDEYLLKYRSGELLQDIKDILAINNVFKVVPR